MRLSTAGAEPMPKSRVPSAFGRGKAVRRRTTLVAVEPCSGNRVEFVHEPAARDLGRHIARRYSNPSRKRRSSPNRRAIDSIVPEEPLCVPPVVRPCARRV